MGLGRRERELHGVNGRSIHIKKNNNNLSLFVAGYYTASLNEFSYVDAG
jgi:hypothetical protein